MNSFHRNGVIRPVPAPTVKRFLVTARSRSCISLAAGFLALLVAAAIGPARATPGEAPHPIAPTAEAYYQWMQSVLAQADTNLPAITEAAQVAADGFLKGRDLGVRGGAGLNEELGARSGGLCVYRATKGKPGDVILYAFGVTTDKEPRADSLLARELADAESLAAEGSTIIGLASRRQLASLGQLERAQSVCKVLMDNYAPAGDGLFRTPDNQAAIPTFITADAMVSWVWIAEFFAACTRAGQTPAMYQSVLNDPDRTRYAKYLKVRFHDDLKVAPIPSGQLGRAYIAEVRALLAKVRQNHWSALDEAAGRAAQTLREGGQVYVFARGHYPPRHVGGQLPSDCSGFRRMRLPRKGATTDFPVPGKADYGIALGYSLPPGDAWWSGADERLRQAGQGVCWIISGHRTRPEHFRSGEVLIDQCWPDGDAALPIAGYDVGICPPSGVMSEALLWMLTAEAWAEAIGNEFIPRP